MKNKYILICFSLLVLNVAHAQKFSGVATYKTDRKVDIKMDSTKMNSDMQSQIAKQLRDQFRKEYELTFTQNESLYKEVPKLNGPTPAAANGVNIVVSGTDDVLYRNISENRFANETEIMGKPFLVADTLATPAWKLENETKFIGDYRCMKATYNREVSEKTFNSENDSLVEVKKNRVTTAWYTLDVPVPHGPDSFFGLPGLILEISEGDLTILCSKVVLNPEKAVAIEEPKKGKKVSQAAFDEIQDKKTQEMMEQFQSDSRRDGKNQSFQIKIGGQ